MAFFALMLSIGYEVEVSPPEGTQVYPGKEREFRGSLHSLFQVALLASTILHPGKFIFLSFSGNENYHINASNVQAFE